MTRSATSSRCSGAGYDDVETSGPGSGEDSLPASAPAASFHPAIRYAVGFAATLVTHVADRQKTISREVTLAGPGLFSGEPATLTFAPADPGAGITFIREQDGKVATIPALVENILKRPRRTCLRNGTLFVETIEHCMAALCGMGIDNAIVRVSGGGAGEIPGFDGSSKRFVEALDDVGVAEQDAPLDPL